MQKLNIDCEILEKDEVLGRLVIKDGKLIKNEVINGDIHKHPFPNSHTLDQILDVLAERVICRDRCTDVMLKHMGLKEYNIYDILRVTHGIDIDDFNWFRFKGENLTWDDVKVRD